MNAWSNIEISPQDSEIIEIDKLEESLGKISENVQKIRELITRFEVCHFKYQQHLKLIKDSISNLKPSVKPNQIGAYHISKGKDTVNKDKTGRSILGQQYVNSLLKWLGDYSPKNQNYFNNQLNNHITKWLGDKTTDKEGLVRLLIARLIWDWKAYEECQQRGKYKEIEGQACRMDICHYAFPKHLDFLLQGIGRMEPVDNFEGCGSFNTMIKTYVEMQFSSLCDNLKFKSSTKSLSRDEKIKFWLTACLAKTLKEHVGLKKSLHPLIRLKQ